MTTSTSIRTPSLRIEDALSATKAAAEEGILAGGGTAFLRAVQNCTLTSPDPDEQTGIDIVKNALVSPARTILKNAGYSDETLNQVIQETGNRGFNSLTGQIEDLLASIVIDPKKVAHYALENAASVAGMFLTLEISDLVLPE